MSISVIYPVHNAQHHLAQDLERLLELLEELSPQFELIVVDNGSTDATEEIVSDWECRYPQLRLLHKLNAAGRETAGDWGLQHARGELLFVIDEVNERQLSHLRRLWLERQATGSTPAPLPSDPEPVSERLVARLMNWGASLQQIEATRDAIEAASAARPAIKRPAMLDRAMAGSGNQAATNVLEPAAISDPRDTNLVPHENRGRDGAG